MYKYNSKFQYITWVIILIFNTIECQDLIFVSPIVSAQSDLGELSLNCMVNSAWYPPAPHLFLTGDVAGDVGGNREKLLEAEEDLNQDNKTADAEEEEVL